MDKRRRIFSEEFKMDRVKEIESGSLRISQISRMHEVSIQSVYQWIYQYSKTRKKGLRMVVEKESESSKRLLLERRVSELERLLGQKQVELEYLNRVIKEGDKLLGVDLKKKFEPKY
jgi:transposase-like protein